MKSITSLLLFFVVLCVPSCHTQKEISDKPNFIIFIAGDAAWNDVGAYGKI